MVLSTKSFNSNMNMVDLLYLEILNYAMYHNISCTLLLWNTDAGLLITKSLLVNGYVRY
jgi:hypothetical protein